MWHVLREEAKFKVWKDIFEYNSYIFLRILFFFLAHSNPYPPPLQRSLSLSLSLSLWLCLHFTPYELRTGDIETVPLCVFTPYANYVFPPYITWVIKSRRMGWAEPLARVVEWQLQRRI